MATLSISFRCLCKLYQLCKRPSLRRGKSYMKLMHDRILALAMFLCPERYAWPTKSLSYKKSNQRLPPLAPDGAPGRTSGNEHRKSCPNSPS